MTCTDCGEEFTESERREARPCAVCGEPLHPECSMLGLDAVDNCERCHGLEQKGFKQAMYFRGVEEQEPAPDDGGIDG